MVTSKVYSIQVMMTEHAHIIDFLKVVRAACIRLMQTKDICEEDFYGFIDFARNYSDKHHHGKEEDFLFNQMVAYLGEAGKTLVQNGMLVEHDLCRSHILDLERALKAYKQDPCPEYCLDIIEAAAGYAHLLSRHIEKENNVVYPFAERGLNPEVLAIVDKHVHEFEAAHINVKKSAALLVQLQQWQKKYGVLESS